MNGRTLSIGEALQNAKVNSLAAWNHSKSSSERSERPSDAANRIFDGFARVQPTYDGPRLKRESAVFAMGSCFAREIEKALSRRGCNVISVDDRILRPEFDVSPGALRSGFFHRFTPFAMYQEFQQAFGEAEGWTDKTLLLEQGAEFVDMNYWDAGGADTSLLATLIRRKVAAELVRTAVNADVVILTLGLVESWFHKPSGFHANKVPAQTLIRRKDEFDLHIVSYEETLACLEGIRSLIARHRTTPFQLVVTVSPVPLAKTFTADDLIVANMNSKSTLRAAAADFCARTPEANYFPSYEMVTYSDVHMAWRPDRTHVEPPMVKHIVKTFVDAYYEPGSLMDDPNAASIQPRDLYRGIASGDASIDKVHGDLMKNFDILADLLDSAIEPSEPVAVQEEVA